MVDKFIDSVKTIGSATSAVVSGTVDFTKSAVEGAADLTKSAVGGAAGLTVSAVSTTANVVGTGLNMLNVKDWVINFAREYILSYCLQEETNTTNRDLLKHNLIFAGAQFLISPAERVRFLIQNQQLYKPDYKPNQYVGSFDCLFREFRQKGFRILFRGGLPLTAYHLIYFNFMDYRIKSMLNVYTKEKEKRTFSNVCLFMKNLYLFDLMMITCTHPLELLAAKAAVNPKKQKFLDHRMYTENILVNPFKLFRGYSASLLCLSLNYAIMTPVVNAIGHKSSDQLQLFIYLIASMFAVEFITYPFDLVKRRMMVQSSPEFAEFKYSTIKGALVKIYREEHISGFYKGCFLKLFNWSARRLIFMGALGYYNDIVKQEESRHTQGKIRKKLKTVLNKLKFWKKKETTDQ